jgi:hypothetical protein
MGGECGLWEDERNPQPEPLEDHGKQESMGADGIAWEGGITQPKPQKDNGRESREEELEVK